MSYPTTSGPIEQLTTFSVGGELFALEVLKVQEVTGSPVVVKLPLAPNFIKGLVNLRGQIATAIGLHELLGLKSKAEGNEFMSVVCKLEGNLISLLVDSIGEVVELDSKFFEPTPLTVAPEIRRYLRGIYKMNGTLLNVLNLETLSKEIIAQNETSTK